MTPEMLITLTTARALQRMEVPGTARPYWTVAEAGQACAWLEPEIFAAMLYSYAGADENYHIVESALIRFGEYMRRDECWPMQVAHDDGTRGDYLPGLVGLCLVEERQPWRFGSVTIGNNAPSVSPIYLAVMRVTERTWFKRLARPYATVRWRYITWLSIGRAHMKRWMRTQMDSRGVHAQVYEALETGGKVG